MNVQAEFDPQNTHKRPDIMLPLSGPTLEGRGKGFLVSWASQYILTDKS